MPRSQEQPGRLAHQAVQLANGTINWRALYGEEAFRLAPPLYESELQRIRAEKEVDLKDLAEKAKQFATAPKTAATSFNPSGQFQQAGQQMPGRAAAAPPLAAPGKPEELPAGWSTAKDTAGRVYYWHTKTKKTTWERPTAETPIQ